MIAVGSREKIKHTISIGIGLLGLVVSVVRRWWCPDTVDLYCSVAAVVMGRARRLEAIAPSWIASEVCAIPRSVLKKGTVVCDRVAPVEPVRVVAVVHRPVVRRAERLQWRCPPIPLPLVFSIASTRVCDLTCALSEPC